jgi:hypothetical protein
LFSPSTSLWLFKATPACFRYQERRLLLIGQNSCSGKAALLSTFNGLPSRRRGSVTQNISEMLSMTDNLCLLGGMDKKLTKPLGGSCASSLTSGEKDLTAVVGATRVRLSNIRTCISDIRCSNMNTFLHLQSTPYGDAPEFCVQALTSDVPGIHDTSRTVNTPPHLVGGLSNFSGTLPAKSVASPNQMQRVSRVHGRAYRSPEYRMKSHTGDRKPPVAVRLYEAGISTVVKLSQGL